MKPPEPWWRFREKDNNGGRSGGYCIFHRLQLPGRFHGSGLQGDSDFGGSRGGHSVTLKFQSSGAVIEGSPAVVIDKNVSAFYNYETERFQVFHENV